MNNLDGKTTEWKSKAMRVSAAHAIVDAVIAGAIATRSHVGCVARSLLVWWCGRQGHGERVWRKVKSDWDAWSARSFAEEPIVRLILDGTVVRVRLDRKATSISLLVVIGVREDGQKVLLTIKSMGGESTDAWRSVLDDLIKRGLRQPEFLIVDGAPGLDKAIAAVWDGVPVQRCTVHKHRNLLAHAPERLHDEITADYTDMIYAAKREEIDIRRKAFIRKCHSSTAPSPTAWRKPATGCYLHPTAAEPMAQRADYECDRAAARGVQTKDQDTNRAAICRHHRHAVLGAARLRPDQHAQGGCGTHRH